MDTRDPRDVWLRLTVATGTWTRMVGVGHLTTICVNPAHIMWVGELPTGQTVIQLLGLTHEIVVEESMAAVLQLQHR